MLSWARAIDVSTWQDDSRTAQRIDWAKTREHVRLVINRVTFGTAVDDDWAYNWARQKDVGLLRGAYGFWDWRSGNPSATVQAQALVAALKADPGEYPVVWMDVERPLPTWPALPSRAQCLAEIERYLRTVEDGLGLGAGVYLNGAMIKHLMSEAGMLVNLPAWLRERPVWIAAWPSLAATRPGESLEAYIERTRWQPNLYLQWQTWQLWQYGTPAVGLAFGMESKEVDADFWNGSEDQLLAFCKQPAGELPAEEVAMYEGKPIGLITSTVNDKAWDNPDFAFFVGVAGSGMSEPNPELKPLEAKAAAAGKPFLALWDFTAQYYIEQQYGPDDAHWPALEQDWPYLKCVEAIRSRDVKAVIVRVADNTNRLDGKKIDPYWMSYSAQTFCGRLATWCAKNKPGCKVVLACSYPFLSANAPGMANWCDQYEQMLTDHAGTLAASYPTTKPGYLNNRQWQLWQYRSNLVLAWQDKAELYAWLGLPGTPVTPPEPPKDDDGDGPKIDLSGLSMRLAQMQEAFERIEEKLAVVTGGVERIDESLHKVFRLEDD